MGASGRKVSGKSKLLKTKKKGPGSKRQLLKTQNAAFKRLCSYSGHKAAAKQTTRLVDVVQEGLPELLLLTQKQAEKRLRQEGVLSPPSWLRARGQVDHVLHCWVCGAAMEPADAAANSWRCPAKYTDCPVRCRVNNAQDVFSPFYSGILNNDDKDYRFFLTTAFGVGIKLGVDQMLHVLKEKDQSNTAVIHKIKRFRSYHLVALAFSEVHRAATHKFSQDIVEPDTARFACKRKSDDQQTGTTHTARSGLEFRVSSRVFKGLGRLGSGV